ncbi:MAG: PEGA domain-containing protein [Candidatus Eisenbacteria bacterium]
MHAAPDEGFQPIHPNPFIVGNPIRGRAMFFGREAEFEFVRKRFAGGESGGLLVFCGERRSGKTSILFQILEGRLGSGFIPVLIDMQSMAVDSESAFLRKLADLVLSAADLSLPTRDRLDPGAAFAIADLQLVLAAVQRAAPGQQLVLLFDEYELFENKIDAGVLSPDVLHVLANLIEHHGIYLVFTGSQHIEDRKRDYWHILRRSQHRRVSYLDRADAVRLVRDPIAGRAEVPDATVESLLRLTAGQPFYTQALCQSLVDHLNDTRSRSASPERLADVVRDLVENPLPQMVFLWDGFEPDEKLVLALLSEVLADGATYANVAQIEALMRKRRYPLELPAARMATVLEKLFKDEFLLKDEVVGTPGYQLRMDLWRLWIRRMHSVWQVVRELGIKLPRPPLGRDPRLLAAVGVLAAGLLGVLVWSSLRPDPSPIAPAALLFRATPDDATLWIDSTRVAIGNYRGPLQAGTDVILAARREGYADSVRPVRAAPGESLQVSMMLRPLRSALAVESVPPGLPVSVDGTARGVSPVVVDGLAVPEEHRVEVRFPNGRVIQRLARVVVGVRTPLRVTAEPVVTQLVLTSEPSGAQVLANGRPRGTTPLTIGDLPEGSQRLQFRLAGRITLDTTLSLHEGSQALVARLVAEPPGTVVVLGDRLGQIFLDDAFIVDGVQNSGKLSVTPGMHAVRVVLAGGETVDTAFTVSPLELVRFDYSKRLLTRTRP